MMAMMSRGVAPRALSARTTVSRVVPSSSATSLASFSWTSTCVFGTTVVSPVRESGFGCDTSNFVEIRTDEDLVRIKAEYVKRREVAVALLEETLSSEVFAMTFALSAPREGERPFVSIIDCRGGKAPRAYFSKWHEIAHLLTLTPQSRLQFCRTHAEPGV